MVNSTNNTDYKAALRAALLVSLPDARRIVAEIETELIAHAPGVTYRHAELARAFLAFRQALEEVIEEE
jgi:hypothetical protein